LALQGQNGILALLAKDVGRQEPSIHQVARSNPVQSITPFLWFDNQAEEAVNFYISLFENSKILDVARYDVDRQPGQVMTMSFVLDGQEFMALNGGPQYRFTEAVSFFVNCENQAKIDKLWNALTAGGEEQPCGWLKDKYGLSWQIVPSNLSELIGGPDPKKAQRAMQAMLQMKKLDIKKLQEAYDNG
jgi:predicted 3-demethylubiquinone-9 3-methyltransferase (glyoxalase superfamily)